MAQVQCAFPWPTLADGLNTLADRASDRANPYVDDTNDDPTAMISEASLYGAVLATSEFDRRLRETLDSMVAGGEITSNAATRLMGRMGADQ